MTMEVSNSSECQFAAVAMLSASGPASYSNESNACKCHTTECKAFAHEPCPAWDES